MPHARILAEDALRTYLEDPVTARDHAAQARAAAAAARDWPVVSLSERVLGLVAGHLADSTAAQRHLKAAVRYGERAGAPALTARARLDLAWVLARCGKTAAALQALDEARPDRHEHAEAGHAWTMRALVLEKLGRWDEALAAYDEALPLVRAGGDRHALADLLGNRGVLHMYRGAPHDAERDLLEADALRPAAGSELHHAITVHNLGYVAALRGQVPLALARYDEAERCYARHREVPLELWGDRGELLLGAGLGAEARSAAQRAVDAATARREPAELAQARLRLAQAELVDGDPSAAASSAERAARAFVRQHRPGWAALAHWTRLQACAARDPGSVSAPVLRKAAGRLERAGWRGAALEARLMAGERALRSGRVADAGLDLGLVSAARHRGPVWHRQLGWHAEAVLRCSRGDRGSALRAAARGVALAEEHRATLGATDLRAAAAHRVAALADLGLRVAVAGGRPETVWRWAERTRAAAMLHPPAQPPDDEAVDRALAELRHVVRIRQDATAAGRHDADLLRRQLQLEETIRRAVRRAESVPGHDVGEPVVADLCQSLGTRALVEYAVCEEQLLAVVAVDGRLTLHRLGPVEPVTRELRYLFFALRRMAAAPKFREERLRSRLEAAASRLDAALLQPLSATLADRDLVVVPAEPVQSLPWLALPSCRGRAVAVAPSARLWCRAAGRPAGAPGRVVLAAGPGLEHAESEVADLARVHRGATVLMGADARVSAVAAAMQAADLVHLAAHGDFRGDNPLFSGIELADGPLTGYDVERLPHPPTVAVLSACESGRVSVLAGSEQLGLAATFLAGGVRSVVAAVLHVPDAETWSLMNDLHRGLREGRPVDAALSMAVDKALTGSDAEAAAGASFLCIGA